MIQTQRLILTPLTPKQLETGLKSIKDLAIKLNTPLVENLITGNAERAVKIKLEKMQNVPASLHPWFTYWLIVIREDNIGAGLIGFKGKPDENGEVEIGYGIDPIFQGKGYTTEATSALIDWAFSHPECKSVTAIDVKIDNYPSHKVLFKSGFVEVDSNENGVSYRRQRE